MSFKYQTGEEIRKGDLILFHRNPGVVEFVAENRRGDPETDWYIDEYGGGVGILEAKDFGRVFISADQLPETEDLEFVRRPES